MELFRTTSSVLTERLDPGHYRPTLLENEAKIRKNGAVLLRTFYSNSGIGHTAAVTPHYSDDGDGVPFVNGGCIQHGSLVLDGAERIKESSHNGVMSGSRLSPGFILAVRKGELGNAAVVPVGLEAANCSSEVFFIEPDDLADAGFLSSYFNSRHGRMAFLRQQRGMMIPSISLYDVPEIPVPRVDELARAYIGNKVRQAEALRAMARATLEEVDRYHRRLIPEEPSGPKKSWSRVGANGLAERLDAEFYPAAVEAYFESYDGDSASLQEVSTSVFNGTTRPTSDGAGVLQATVANLSATFLEPEFRRVTLNGPSKKQIQDRDLLICAAAHNASYIGKDITFATAGDEPVIPSTEVLLVRPDRDRVPSSYLRGYFQSPIGYLQIQACVRGITAHLYPADLSLVRIPVPAVAESEREAWFTLDDALVDAAEQVNTARRLTQAARLLVEALIERKVSEADLVAAHKSPEADRALLERLTADGIDASKADPLFSDLDRLAELLAEARQEEAS